MCLDLDDGDIFKGYKSNVLEAFLWLGSVCCCFSWSEKADGLRRGHMGIRCIFITAHQGYKLAFHPFGVLVNINFDAPDVTGSVSGHIVSHPPVYMSGSSCACLDAWRSLHLCHWLSSSLIFQGTIIHSSIVYRDSCPVSASSANATMFSVEYQLTSCRKAIWATGLFHNLKGISRW